jgi:ubiquinone/menaquinone biosynthesis C-methylase UbiE
MKVNKIKAIKEIKRVAKEEGESPEYQAKEFAKNPKANMNLKKVSKILLKKKKKR